MLLEDRRLRANAVDASAVTRVKPAPGQLPLGAFAPTKAQSDHLFFAVLPEPAAARRIVALAEKLRRQHALRGRALRPERLHISLCSLGSVDRSREPPRGVISGAGRAASGIGVPAFDVTFDSVCSFGRGQGERPLVLYGDAGLASLHALLQALDERLRDEGFAAGARSKFTPHITLLYDEGVVAPQAVDPIAWTVREFVLIRSLVGRSEYRFLGRWPLRS